MNLQDSKALGLEVVPLYGNPESEFVKQIPLPGSLLCRSVSAMAENSNERPLFNHPPWMVGIVLILAVMSILAGLSDPIWFLLGLPCILVLALYIYVRVVTRIRDGRKPDV